MAKATKATQTEKVTVRLAKSLIGRSDKQIKTANSLGLRKIGDVISHDAGAVLDGKLKVIAHMIKIEGGSV